MKWSIQRNARSLFLGAISAALISGCASIERVQYPAAANPAEEVSKLDQEMNEALTAQHDVLAPKEFRRSQRHLDEAKEELAKGDVDDFWDELGAAKAYLDRAEQIAARRAPKIQAVLQTRQAAIDAGARRFEDTRKEIGALDDSLRKNVRALDKNGLKNEIWDRTSVNYGALHVNTVRDAEVGEARDMIASAKKRGARIYAPRTLREAEIALEQAERAIGAQPDNKASYLPLTNRANEQARLLVAVTATSRKASGQTNEQVAREIVGRNRALSNMQSELQGADAEAAATRRALASKEESLQGMAASNLGLRSESEWNKALEEARAEFDEEEADVYRQGDRLLIRLKKINFPTGSAEVPEDSKELLTKVTTVIEELNAKNVEVQGHTDSTGSPQINKKISKKRAEAVAGFLEDEVDEVQVKAVGYGFEKPIAANRSKAGRAINRRVDVVITPTKVGASENREQDESDESEVIE